MNGGNEEHNFVCFYVKPTWNHQTNGLTHKWTFTHSLSSRAWQNRTNDKRGGVLVQILIFFTTPRSEHALPGISSSSCKSRQRVRHNGNRGIRHHEAKLFSGVRFGRVLSLTEQQSSGLALTVSCGHSRKQTTTGFLKHTSCIFVWQSVRLQQSDGPGIHCLGRDILVVLNIYCIVRSALCFPSPKHICQGAVRLGPDVRLSPCLYWRVKAFLFHFCPLDICGVPCDDLFDFNEV